MSMASSQQSFFTSTLNPTIENKKKSSSPMLLSCRSSMDSNNKHDRDPTRKEEMQLVKVAIATFATGVLVLGSAYDANAAKSGGRVGGQAFRSAAPRASSPRINNSRTNIYINPPVAPPLIGGYGYGVPFYGGWGWTPFSFFTPGPSVAVGIGGGFEVLVFFLVLGAVATVIRRFRGSRDDEDEDYY